MAGRFSGFGELITVELAKLEDDAKDIENCHNKILGVIQQKQRCLFQLLFVAYLVVSVFVNRWSFVLSCQHLEAEELTWTYCEFVHRFHFHLCRPGLGHQWLHTCHQNHLRQWHNGNQVYEQNLFYFLP